MTKPMLDSKLMYPTEYLASEEFLGKDITLTIKGISIDNLRMSDGGVEQKPVLTFEKTDKKLVLNKTNATTIAELHGAEARKWVGKRVTLYPTTCSAFGKTVDCIRVKPTASRPAKGSDVAETATTSVESDPATILEQMQAIADKERCTASDLKQVRELSGLPQDDVYSDLVVMYEEAGDFKIAIKAVIGKYEDANEEVTG